MVIDHSENICHIGDVLQNADHRYPFKIVVVH